jgi:hypothetical protein
MLTLFSDIMSKDEDTELMGTGGIGKEKNAATEAVIS